MANIKAIEYESVGLDDYSSDKWIDSETKVEHFLSLYLTDEYFYKIIALNFNYKYLRNWRRLGIKRDKKSRIIDALEEAINLRNEIKLACTSKGHMSILFITLESSGFMNRYLELGYYKTENLITIGTGNKEDPLAKDQALVFLNTLFSILDTDICASVFSHDADCLYHITKI